MLNEWYFDQEILKMQSNLKITHLLDIHTFNFFFLRFLGVENAKAIFYI